MTNQINNQSIIPSTDVIKLTLALKMTTAVVVETSVTVNNNSPIQDYVHPDDQTQPTFELSYSYTLPAGNANRFRTSSSKKISTVQWKPPPHSTAMNTKTAVSFGNIFMAYIETRILSKTVFKPTVWKPP